MSRRRVIPAAVVAFLLVTAGCGATAHPTDRPERNATLPGHDPTAEASPVETRAFWDRSSNWEDPRTRNATVTSRSRAYHDVRGADAVVVYTTPKKPYVKVDRPRSMLPTELASLATDPVAVSPAATDSRPAHAADLLDRNETVHALIDADGAAAGRVASVATSDAVVVVVVIGGDRRTVDRILGDVTV